MSAFDMVPPWARAMKGFAVCAIAAFVSLPTAGVVFAQPVDPNVPIIIDESDGGGAIGSSAAPNDAVSPPAAPVAPPAPAVVPAPVLAPQPAPQIVLPPAAPAVPAPQPAPASPPVVQAPAPAPQPAPVVQDPPRTASPSRGPRVNPQPQPRTGIQAPVVTPPSDTGSTTGSGTDDGAGQEPTTTQTRVDPSVPVPSPTPQPPSQSQGDESDSSSSDETSEARTPSGAPRAPLTSAPTATSQAPVPGGASHPTSSATPTSGAPTPTPETGMPPAGPPSGQPSGTFPPPKGGTSTSTTTPPPPTTTSNPPTTSTKPPKPRDDGDITIVDTVITQNYIDNSVVINNINNIVNQTVNNVTNNITNVNVTDVRVQNIQTGKVYHFAPPPPGQPLVLPGGWCGGAGGSFAVSASLDHSGLDVSAAGAGYFSTDNGCGYVPPPPPPQPFVYYYEGQYSQPVYDYTVYQGEECLFVIDEQGYAVCVSDTQQSYNGYTVYTPEWYSPDIVQGPRYTGPPTSAGLGGGMILDDTLSNASASPAVPIGVGLTLGTLVLGLGIFGAWRKGLIGFGG